MYRKHIKFPSKTGIKRRAGHLNNAFYQTAFPQILPTDSEEDDLLQKLGMGNEECAYCGRHAKKLDADHLHPLISHNGSNEVYLTDITNIVPCCPECNNKKGNQSFEEFYTDPSTKQYLRKCGLTYEQYEDRLKRISEYAENSRRLLLSKDDEQSKDYILTIKDLFCDLLNKYAMFWGNSVMKENGIEMNVDIKDKLTDDDLKKIQQIGEILNVDTGLKNKISKYYKQNKTDKETPLW